MPAIPKLPADLRLPSADIDHLLMLLEPFATQSPRGVGDTISLDTFLVQQLRAAAHDEGEDSVRDACDRWLAGRPALAVGSGARCPADRRLRRTLSGHSWTVTGALVLADGRILSWAEDQTLRLWSSQGECLRVLEGHSSDVTGAMALPDGRILSWSGFFGFAEGSQLRLWTSEGDPLRVLEGHADGVDGALMLADGHILSWSWDGTLRLWSADGKPLAVYANGDGITACAHLGGNRFAFGDAGGRVPIVEVRG